MGHSGERRDAGWGAAARQSRRGGRRIATLAGRCAVDAVLRADDGSDHEWRKHSVVEEPVLPVGPTQCAEPETGASRPHTGTEVSSSKHYHFRRTTRPTYPGIERVAMHIRTGWDGIVVPDIDRRSEAVRGHITPLISGPTCTSARTSSVAAHACPPSPARTKSTKHTSTHN
jgi:hypothetical protein